MTRPVPSDPHPPAASSDPPSDDADSRDYERFAQDQDALDIEAATWATRRRRGMDADMEAEFDAWLAADPRHQAAYDDMEDTFGRLRGLPDEDIGSLKATLPADLRHAAGPAPSPAHPGVSPPPRAARAGRRGWLAGLLPHAAAAGLACAALGAGWGGWNWWLERPGFEQAFGTAKGQQLKVDLPDGSRLDLDTDTRLAVRLYPRHREVTLIEGQALFTVRADAQRPFRVLADTVRVTVVGTRFSVRHTSSGLDPGQTRVVVESGLVRVESAADARAPGDGQGRAVDLAPGQAVVADARGGLGPVTLIAPGNAAAWRDGRVNFDGTPLAQALAEFGRYGTTGVVVRDPDVAALRVGGSFGIRNLSGFLEALPAQLPVRLQRRAGEIEVVKAR